MSHRDSSSGSGAADRRDAFLRQAAVILQQFGGLTSASVPLLRQAAVELGLSAGEVREAMQQLPAEMVRPPDAGPPPLPPGSSGQTPPVPPPSSSAAIPQPPPPPQANGAPLVETSRQTPDPLAETRPTASKTSQPAAREEAPLDPKVEEFLRRAEPVLAQLGGVNAQSLIRLNVIVQELGLNKAQRQQAMKALYGSAGRTEGPRDEQQQQQLAAFKNYLRQEMQHHAGRLVASGFKQRFLDAAEQLGLHRHTAEEALREAAAEMKIQFVSETDALEIIAGQVAEKMGSAGGIDYETREQLWVAGGRYGLDPEQVDDLIRRHGRGNRLRKMSFAGLMFLALCTAGGLAAFMILGRGVKSPEPGGQTAGNGDEKTRNGGAAKKTAKSDAWWDVELALAMTRARRLGSNWEQMAEGVKSTDPDQRGQAYEQLVALTLGGDAGQPPEQPAKDAPPSDQPLSKQPPAEKETPPEPPPDPIQVAETIVGGCYALDPADEGAAHLRQALLRRIPSSGDALAQPREYEDSLTAAGLAAVALEYPSLKEDRRGALAAGIQSALGVSIDARQDAKELRKHCTEQLCRKIYRTLIAAAAGQPAVVVATQKALAKKLKQHLPRELREALEVDFLAAVLPKLGAAWREYEPQIGRYITSGAPVAVLKLVDAYERITDAGLRRFMTGRFLMRVRSGSDASPDEVAALVRRSLGSSAPGPSMSEGRRWQAFQNAASVTLAGLRAAPDDKLRLLRETVELSHRGTLGCALAHKDLGGATFDQLYRDGPEKLAAGATRTGRTPSRNSDPLADAVRNNFRRLVLALHNNRLRAARPAQLRTLANTYAPRVDELDAQTGESLAEYLLSNKPEAEHKVVMEHVKSLTAWKEVRLAIADKLEDSRLRRDYLQELLTAVVGRKVDVYASDDWRDKVRAELLRGVLADFALSPSSKSDIFDQASQALVDHYAAQAKLWGVPAGKLRSAALPGQALRALVEHYAAELTKRMGGGGRLDRIPHDLIAIEYLGDNDLGNTVLLQRLYLELLALDLSQKLPERAKEAADIVAKLAEHDRDSRHVLDQLRQGEAAQVRMWLLWNKR